MEVLFGLFFILFFAAFFTILIRSIGEWFKNNASPRLTVPAKVVAKRSSHHHHHHGHGGMHHSTRYHVTFEVESGDRMELSVSGSEYACSWRAIPAGSPSREPGIFPLSWIGNSS